MTESSVKPTDVPDAASPPPRRQWVTWLTLVAVPVLGGLIGFAAQLYLVRPDDAPQASQRDAPRGAMAELPSVDQVDELLAAGDYQRARQLFQQSSASNSLLGPLPVDLRARYALCAELHGDFTLALDIYRQLSQETHDAGIRRFAKISQARLHYRQQAFDVAESLLFELAITTGNGATLHEKEAIWHFMAHLAADRLLAADKPRSLLETDALVLGASDWFRPLLFPETSVVAEKPAEPPLGLGEEMHLDRWSPNDLLPAIEGDVITRQVETLSVLRELAGRCGVTLEYSTLAREVLRNRTVNVNVRSIRLADLLDALLVPLELAWWEEDDHVVRVAAQKEINAGVLLAQREERAERTALHAVTHYPDSAGVPITQFKLGNLAFERGSLASASAHYRQLLAERPPAAIRQACWFNLAKTHYVSSEWDAARECYWHVVDESRGHPLESISFLWMARIEQESLNYEKAQPHLVRAAMLAQEEPIKNIAVTALAANFLLAGNPTTATLTLQEHRSELMKYERDRRVTALLSALCRMESPASQNAGLSGRLLATAMIQAKVEDFFGYLGYPILSRGYRLLGLTEQEISTLTAGIQKTPVNPLHFQMRLELARRQMERRLDAQALEHLQYLVAEGPEAYRDRAKVMMAQVTFRRGDFAQCALELRKLLDEIESVELRKEALALLGRTYQREGRHYEAAMCFAGLLPGATHPTSVNTAGAREPNP